MGQSIEICVPDIGDFEEVEVVEILVAPGDAVAFDDPVVSVESDKATMEIPASSAGVVTEVRVCEGDKVSEGSVLVLLGADADDSPRSSEEAAAETASEAVSKTDAEPTPDAVPISFRYAQFGADFIANSSAAQRKFLLYVAWSHMHVPLVHSRAFQGKSGIGPLGGTACAACCASEAE